MDKNISSVEENDKGDNSSEQGSGGELFVNRVAKSGVVLKFKVRKYGTSHSSSNVLSRELTFSGGKSASGQSENLEANTQNLSEQSGMRNTEPRNNKISFPDSAMGTNTDEEIIRPEETLNNSSMEADPMVSLKSVAMDTCTTGVNGTNSSQTAEIYSTDNVINGLCLTANHETCASEKTCSHQSEEHICHQCGKGFKSIGSLYGHMGCHRREEYKRIRMMQEQPHVTETSGTVIQKRELKNVWKASKTLIKISMVAGPHPVHSSKATDVIRSSEDIHEDTTDMMEVADLLIELSQTVREDVVKAPESPPSSRVFTCTPCNKVFDSYQALGGHVSSHNKPKTRKLVDIIAGNSSGSSEPQTFKYLCRKCNERFPTGQSLGGHKRKHWFEEHNVSPVTDGNVKAPVSPPRYTVEASGAALPGHDDLQSTETDLKEVDDTVNLPVPKAYDVVQPFQANNLAHKTELASGVAKTVIDADRASTSFSDPTCRKM